MSNKKDIKEQVRSDVTMLEELTKLKKDIETYKEDGGRMGLEIISLKRQCSGLKAQNTILKNEVKKLQEQVEHYKQLANESDELNEKKAEKIEWLSKELKKANEKTEELSKHVDSIQEKNVALGKENTSLRTTIENYKNMPWYKKVFHHN